MIDSKDLSSIKQSRFLISLIQKSGKGLVSSAMLFKSSNAMKSAILLSVALFLEFQLRSGQDSATSSLSLLPRAEEKTICFLSLNLNNFD